MVKLQLMKPATQKMQDQKEIGDDEDGVNAQLNQKCAERFGRFLFHAFHPFRVVTGSRSSGITG
jgi:hypothetical protein